MSRLEDKAKARKARIASKVTRTGSRIEPDLDRPPGDPRMRFGKVSIRTINRQTLDERGVGHRAGGTQPRRTR